MTALRADGTPIPASVSGGHVALRTRNGHDAAQLFQLLGKPTWLAAPAAIIDGEVVALIPGDGPTSACSRPGWAAAPVRPQCP